MLGFDSLEVFCSKFRVFSEQMQRMGKQGGSPGIVVMGRDSRSKGRGFDSWRRILDGHFSHLFVVKIVKFV